MGRAGFVVQRLLLLIPVAVGVTIIVFFMVHLIPGDPAATILGIHATPKAVFLLIYAFAISLHLFPVSGYGSGFTGHLQSMFLPSLTVALALTPVVIRSLRASMLNVLTAEYIVTARSKGVPPHRLFLRHVLRNAVIPAVTVLAINIGFLVGTTVIIEQIFAVPGIGQLMINSIFQRDFPVVQG